MTIIVIQLIERALFFHFIVLRKIEEETGIVMSPSHVRAVRQDLGWKYRTTRYCALIRHANRPKRKLWAEQCIADLETFEVCSTLYLPTCSKGTL